MSLNLNDADKQKTFEAIPDGTFVRLLMQIKPNGFTLPGCDAMDSGLFKTSTRSDAVMLECEFTVMAGPYQHRKFVEYWTVAGGSLDDKGHSKGFSMTKTRMRAAIESNQGVRPDDESAQAVATRRINGFKELDGIEFWAKIDCDPGEAYVDERTGEQKMGYDKNKIGRIVTPDAVEYADLAAGKPVDPKPRNVSRLTKPAAGAAPAARSWGGDAKSPELPMGQPAAAQPAPAQTPTNKPSWLRK